MKRTLIASALAGGMAVLGLGVGTASAAPKPPPGPVAPGHYIYRTSTLFGLIPWQMDVTVVGNTMSGHFSSTGVGTQSVIVPTPDGATVEAAQDPVNAFLGGHCEIYKTPTGYRGASYALGFVPNGECSLTRVP